MQDSNLDLFTKTLLLATLEKMGVLFKQVVEE